MKKYKLNTTKETFTEDIKKAKLMLKMMKDKLEEVQNEI